MTTRDRLIQLFHALPQQEQNVLLVLSVVYAPIGQNQLITLLKSGGFDSGTIQNINRDFWERFQKMGFITQREGWGCHPEMMESLMRIAIEQPWFTKLMQQIIMDKSAFSYMPPEINVLHQVKRMRLFLYQGNETGFAANISYLYDHFHHYFFEQIYQLFFANFDAIWFASLPQNIRFLVLKYMLIGDGMKFDEKQHRLYLLLEDNFSQGAQSIEIQQALLEHRLLRGNEKDARHWLSNDYSANGLKLQGIFAFLHNQYDEALDKFNLALKLLRKNNKRTATLGGMADFFYGMMLLRTCHLANLQTLQTYLALCAKKNNDIFSGLNDILTDALDVYQGKKSIEKASKLVAKKHLPFENFAQLLLLYWLGETDKLNTANQQSLWLAPLANDCQIAHELDYKWFAAMSATLLVKLNYTNKSVEKIAKHYANTPYLELIDSFPRMSAWERALEALSQLNTLHKTTLNATTAHSRLVWALSIDDDDDMTFDPKEQRLGKNGNWSKGRTIALKRLYHELDSFQYLTDQDIKICKNIRLSRTQDSYYGYYSDTYFFPQEVLFDAIGHPHVYWASQIQYDSPIDIKASEPQLIIDETDGKLHLSMQPKIPHDAKMVVQKTATGVLIYNIDEYHQEVAKILGEEGVNGPSNERQKLINTISNLQSTLTIQSNMVGMATQAQTVTADNRLHLHLQPIGEGIHVDIFIQPFLEGGPLYKPANGGTTVLAEIEGKQLQTTRNFAIEKDYLNQLFEKCPNLQPNTSLKWQLDEPDIALEALLNLQNITEFAVLEWPKGKKIKISREMGLTQARFSVRQEKNWFTVEGDLVIDDETVLDMQRLMHLLANSSGRFLKLEDGQIIALTNELRQRLDDLSGLGEIKNDKIQFHALAAQTLDELTQGMSINASKPWKEQLKRLDELSDFTPKVPSTLQGELRDYQHEGFLWMSRLAYWGAGACLADDMGLGKTVQALALILSRAPQGPTLILAPTSVCINWLEECARFAPTLNAQQFGTGDRQTMLDHLGPFDLIVCSYGLLQTEAERLQKIQWHTLIADEAQAIKNTMTKRSKAAMALQADFRMVTTGTPIENHLGELWNLFNFINPGLLGSLSRFNERYANAIEDNHDHATQQRLKKLLRPFILRRLKNDVLTELPARTEVTLHIELSHDERAIYEALRRNALKVMREAGAQSNQQLQVLAEIMKLRRACCHPRLVIEDSAISSSKLHAFEELVDELLENRHKALVFSQFVGHLALIRELLDKKGIAYHYLDGSTPVARRKKAMNAFQAGEGDLFLISLKAGGTGLNLTAADYVIHMDPWWNPAVEDQASDRAHRMGQKRPVTIYRLVTKDTIEDKIVELHHLKRDLANSLLEGGEISGKMSVEDMVALLRDAE